MQWRRRVVDGGLTAAMALAIAAGLTRWIDLDWVPVVFIQSAMKVVAAVIVALTALAVALRRRRIAVVGLVASLVVGAMVVPAFLNHTVAPGPEDLIIVSSNVELGMADPVALLAQVRAWHTDILILLEVTQPEEQALLAKGLGADLPYHVGRALPGAAGVIVRSRYPLTKLPAPIRALYPQLQPVARVDAPTGSFIIRAVHPPAPIPELIDAWHDELAALGEWQRQQDGPLIMAGDFNAATGHPAYRKAVDGLVETHRQAGVVFQRTWPQKARIPAFTQIDHIVVRGFEVVDAGSFVVVGSDHAAVWARVRLATAAPE